MLSRKQLLHEFFVRGIRALGSFDDSFCSRRPGRDSETLMFNELNPSLLKMEAERLGIDPGRADETDLRDRIYAALDKECRRQSESSTKTMTERSEEWNDLVKAI